MSEKIGQVERITQNRIVKLFSEKLGYEYLGNFEDRLNNCNIEEKYLTKFLAKKGYSQILVSKAIDKLKIIAGNPNESLYNNNKNTYSLLRYGVQVL